MTKSSYTYWITGLPGAGKTSLANELYKYLNESAKIHPVLLDGDMLRIILNKQDQYDLESRKELAFAYSRFAKLLNDQGFSVIVATVSLFHDIHTYNRANYNNYYEIFIDTPKEVLIQRNQKSLYSDAIENNCKNIMGMDLLPEFPKTPDYRVINDGKLEIDVIFKQIKQFIPLPQDNS